MPVASGQRQSTLGKTQSLFIIDTAQHVQLKHPRYPVITITRVDSKANNLTRHLEQLCPIGQRQAPITPKLAETASYAS